MIAGRLRYAAWLQAGLVADSYVALTFQVGVGNSHQEALAAARQYLKDNGVEWESGWSLVTDLLRNGRGEAVADGQELKAKVAANKAAWKAFHAGREAK